MDILIHPIGASGEDGGDGKYIYNKYHFLNKI